MRNLCNVLILVLKITLSTNCLVVYDIYLMLEYICNEVLLLVLDY